MRSRMLVLMGALAVVASSPADAYVSVRIIRGATATSTQPAR